MFSFDTCKRLGNLLFLAYMLLMSIFCCISYIIQYSGLSGLKREAVLISFVIYARMEDVLIRYLRYEEQEKTRAEQDKDRKYNFNKILHYFIVF